MVEEGKRAKTETARTARSRVALVAGFLLAALVAVILLASSSGSPDEGAAATAPTRCLEAWNSDQEALAFGAHNSVGHGYSDVQVGFMPAAGSAGVSVESGSGECTVVFAGNELDSEPIAAGQIHLESRWVPLSERLEPIELAELQSAAIEEANATVAADGKLTQR